jgi:hypothetical protein
LRSAAFCEFWGALATVSAYFYATEPNPDL